MLFSVVLYNLENSLTHYQITFLREKSKNYVNGKMHEMYISILFLFHVPAMEPLLTILF